MMKSPAGKFILSIVIVTLLNAIVLGGSSEYLLSGVETTGERSVLTYVKSMLTALTYLIISFYWLIYIPFLLLFEAIIIRSPNKSLLIYFSTGAFVGLLGCVLYLLAWGALSWNALYFSTTLPSLVNIPTLTIVGALYGGIAKKLLLVAI